MIEEIFLDNLNMNHFTEFDAELYCQFSLINPDNIITLNLQDNNLTDINGVNIFKNLQYLSLGHNKITDLNPLKNLKKLKNLDLSFTDITDINILSNLINLKNLDIDNLNLTDEKKTIKILKTLPNLKGLWCDNTFKTVDIFKEIKRNGLKIKH